MNMPYAELHCISNFTFLRGASHPEELVARAQELGYAALAITDECSLAGIVRAHVEAKKCSLPLIIGSEFRLDDGLRLVLLATDRESYGRLSALITRGRRRAHARARAPRAAGHADRNPLEDLCRRSRLRAASERRAPPAPARDAAPRLSCRVARRNAGHRRTLSLFARYAALRISRGD